MNQSSAAQRLETANKGLATLNQERADLNTRRTELGQRQAALEAEIKTVQRRIDVHGEALQDLLTQLRQEQTETIKAIGAITASLSENATRRQEVETHLQRFKLERIAEQQEECLQRGEAVADRYRAALVVFMELSLDLLAIHREYNLHRQTLERAGRPIGEGRPYPLLSVQEYDRILKIDPNLARAEIQDLGDGARPQIAEPRRPGRPADLPPVQTRGGAFHAISGRAVLEG